MADRVTAQQFAEWLKAWGSTMAFARRCGIDYRRVHEWARGDRKVPILMPIVQELLDKEKESLRNGNTHPQK